jgi:hypothetical protein
MVVTTHNTTFVYGFSPVSSLVANAIVPFVAAVDNLHSDFLNLQQHPTLVAVEATDELLGLTLIETDDTNLHTLLLVQHALVVCEQNLCAGLDLVSYSMN